MKVINHQTDRNALRRAELPSLEERVAALEEIITTNPALKIPAKAQAVLEGIAAARAKYPERGNG